MTQKGEHTWDVIVHYHRCPKCGLILESREGYQYRLGKYQKDLECPRCHQNFTVTKLAKVRPAPFFGEADKAEITWS